ncbi:MAG: InlB B-repeat-containing protein [Oscillospiraceae bacterium]|nr:InlB B-repeat-containing protein [Oscillospiraceae bacterium]
MKSIFKIILSMTFLFSGYTAIVAQDTENKPSRPEKYIELTTNYRSLTIKCSDGRFAEIVDLKKNDGDLDLYYAAADIEGDYVDDWRFEIPFIDGDLYYTIIPTTDVNSFGRKIEHFQAFIGNNVISEEIASSFSAPQTGEFKFFASGRLETKLDSSVLNRLWLSSYFFTTPWSGYRVVGESTGFTFIPHPDKIEIFSENLTEVNISFGGGYTENQFPNSMPVDNNGITIYEENGVAVVVDSGQNEIARMTMNCNVTFYDTIIYRRESITVPYGSKIKRPPDPESEGRIFDGWFKDENRTILWDFDNDVITRDGQYIYPGWIGDTDYSDEESWYDIHAQEELPLLSADKEEEEDFNDNADAFYIQDTEKNPNTNVEIFNSVNVILSAAILFLTRKRK